jgi:hypothetical protein
VRTTIKDNMISGKIMLSQRQQFGRQIAKKGNQPSSSELAATEGTTQSILQ